MSQPITWRTIMGPSASEALRPLQAAQASFQNVFDGIGKAIQGYQNAEQASNENRWNAGKDANTQAFLNKLYAVGDAETLQRMQKSGELAKMAGAYGPQIDQATVRNAMDGRLATLQERDKTAWAFANAAIDQKEAPARDQIKMLLAKGDTASMEAARGLASSLSARGQAAMWGQLDERTQALVKRDRDNTRWNWDVAEEAHKAQKRPGELKQQAATLASTYASTAASVQATNVSKKEEAFRDEERARSDARAILNEKLRDNAFKDGKLTSEAQPELGEMVRKLIPDKESGAIEKRAKINQVIGELIAKGGEITVTNADGKEEKRTIRDIPLAFVRQAIMGAQDQTLSWNGGYADQFKENLNTLLQAATDQPLKGPDGKPILNPDGSVKTQRVSKVLLDEQRFREIMKDAQVVQPRGGGKK